MAPGPSIDIGGIVQSARERVSMFMHPERMANELLEILRDTHRILVKVEEMVDRLDGTAREWEEKLSGFDVSPKRIDRLEEAVLNIERATAGVEGAMNALPRVLRTRIWRDREGQAPPL